MDAGNPGSTYVWDNNYNGQVRVVNSSGAYYVTVTNAGGCIDSDTINVFMKNNPVSALGNDTTVCIGQPLTLNAGNDGINYYWNTGATSNIITANTGGIYSVQIVGSNGCIKTDSIEIIHNGNAPAFTNIQAQNLAPYTFKLSALNPTNVIGYKWDFGDGTPFNYQNAPTHTYPAVGNYVVTLWVSSSCGVVYDTLSVHIYSTGINNILTDDQINVYPNPTSNIVKVETDLDNSIEMIIVLDLLGRQLYTDKYADKNNVRQIDLSKYADGMYQLQIQTSKGTIHKKVEKIR